MNLKSHKFILGHNMFEEFSVLILLRVGNIGFKIGRFLK